MTEGATPPTRLDPLPQEPMGLETDVIGGHHWVHDPENCWCVHDEAERDSEARP